MPHLRLYLDTADVAEWHWLSTGLFYGITSNPLLLERAGIPCTLEALQPLVDRALGLGAQEVQVQTWGSSVTALVETGRSLAAIAPSVVVKVPITQTGAAAARQLIEADVPVTLTAVYTVHQVLIGAALGAAYVAPYLGRINDSGRDGRRVLAQMQQVLTGVQSKTRILTASIRDVEDISELAAQGLDTFTFGAAIARTLFEVPATLAATADFERAAVSPSITPA